MKNIPLLLALFLLTITLNAQEDYIIQINGKSFDAEPDKNYKIEINGETVNFKLKLKDTLTYEDDLFSFKYLKDYKVSKTVIEKGLEQISIVSAEGSGILIQKYSTFNPTMISEMLLTEVTKESINYGFKMERRDYKRKLASGQKVDVSKAVLNYKDETNIYEVTGIGNKDEGIIILTMMMDDEMNKQGVKIINLMWDSIIFK